MKPNYPSNNHFHQASLILSCDIAAIKAVAEIESGPNGAFLESGEPVILFEPHVFHKFTNGKYNEIRIPNVSEKWGVISYPKWRKGWYGPVSMQHKRLQFASTLDRDAALKSASWGLFQIMGYNHVRCDYLTLQSFVNAMYNDVADHLNAFCNFIISNGKLLNALRNHDWKTFKLIYNGPGKNDYDKRIAKAYQRLIED